MTVRVGSGVPLEDQVGAFAGPLVVAAVAVLTGALWPALAVLVIPGALALLILVWIRRRMGDPAAAAQASPASADLAGPTPHAGRSKLPRRFWLFASAAAASTAGLVTFGVISYHLTRDHVVSVAAVPVIYAGAMATEAVAALATGWIFDRINGRVLLVLPFLTAAVPMLVFTGSVSAVVVGMVLWGAANGIQDSTVKALVADLVPAPRRATAYGVFAAVQGSAAVAGGVLAGALYSWSLPALVAAVGATQVAALVLIVASLRRGDRRP